MKANELRIGNLVSEMVLETVPISGIEPKHVWVTVNDELQYHLDVYSLIPIPLTEEWMNKLGFEGIENPNHTNSIVYTNHSNIEIIYSKFGYNLRDINVQVKYVHSLQNLFFALTSEELIIK